MAERLEPTSSTPFQRIASVHPQFCDDCESSTMRMGLSNSDLTAECWHYRSALSHLRIREVIMKLHHLVVAVLLALPVVDGRQPKEKQALRRGVDPIEAALAKVDERSASGRSGWRDQLAQAGDGEGSGARGSVFAACAAVRTTSSRLNPPRDPPSGGRQGKRRDKGEAAGRQARDRGWPGEAPTRPVAAEEAAVARRSRRTLAHDRAGLRARQGGQGG